VAQLKTLSRDSILANQKHFLLRTIKRHTRTMQKEDPGRCDLAKHSRSSITGYERINDYQRNRPKEKEEEN
jgi:hypothetical protein